MVRPIFIFPAAADLSPWLFSFSEPLSGSKNDGRFCLCVACNMRHLTV